MKNPRTSSGRYGAASSVSGAPHTPKSMGSKPPAITNDGQSARVGYSAGQGYRRSGADDAKVKKG